MTIRRRVDATGRALPAKDRMQSTGVWADQKWISLGVELLESYAWRAQSGNARKVVDRLIVEHLHHGSLENGNLAVTYSDFLNYGIRRHSVRLALEEAIALGLINIVEPGAKAWGGFKGKPCRYRLTWFGTKDGGSPTNRWKRFDSLEKAKEAARGARISTSASRVRSRQGRARALPARKSGSLQRSQNHFSSVERGTISSVESDTGPLGMERPQKPGFSSVDSGTSLYISGGEAERAHSREDRVIHPVAADSCGPATPFNISATRKNP
jgi:hypothetical protein